MKDNPPVIMEPRMPPLFSQVFGLKVSTVPSWDEVWRWEKELLRRKYHNKETFLSIAKDFNMSRCTLRTTYNRIYDKIRAQSSL